MDNTLETYFDQLFEAIISTASDINGDTNRIFEELDRQLKESEAADRADEQLDEYEENNS